MRLNPRKRDRQAQTAPPPVVADQAPVSLVQETAAHAPAPTSSDVTFFTLGSEEFALIALADNTAPALATLSEAETRILAELATGRSNQEIAVSRGTSLRTVTNQVSAVFQKLGVRSRSELVLLLSGGGGGGMSSGDSGGEVGKAGGKRIRHPIRRGKSH